MGSRRWRRRARAAAAAGMAVALVSGCGSGGASASRGPRGQRLEVAAVWSGVEQRNFERVLRAFTRRTGVTIRYTSAGYSVPVFLRARLAAHRLPDVAFLPQPGLLRRYAAGHLLVPLNGIAGAAVASNYNATWRRLGSVGTTLYGVWFKAADKSLDAEGSGQMYSDGITGPGDLGRRIVARRRQLGWSREQLAVRAGVSASYLTYIETHPAVVTVACLAGLAEALGTTVATLLGAGATGRDGATAMPAPADLWLPDVITGRHGERPGLSLG